jgi:hypothetical protein
MNRREFNVAYANAEIRALIAIKRFEKEFDNGGNQNRQRNVPAAGQNNNAPRNIPQQPVYRG